MLSIGAFGELFERVSAWRLGGTRTGAIGFEEVVETLRLKEHRRSECPATLMSSTFEKV